MTNSKAKIYTPDPATQGHICYNPHEGLSGCCVWEDEVLPETWAKLKATPWQPGDQPGMFTKQVIDKVAVYTARTSLCQDCGVVKWRMVMLHDVLWARLYPDNGIACPDCISKRLGRPLEAEDLKFAQPD